MSQILSQAPPLYTRLWIPIRTQLQHNNAYLLPLRLFIGLGWLRASVEKLIEPDWLTGDALIAFFNDQLAHGAIYFPFYETLVTDLFTPHAFVLSWIIILGELLAGIAILTGTLTNLALLGGLFMNLNFVLSGVVNPSAFYIVIQGVLFHSNVGATMGGDSILSRILPSVLVTAQPDFEIRPTNRRKWGYLFLMLIFWSAAILSIPFIRDYSPHSVDDPAMLILILTALGGLLMGILYLRSDRIPLLHEDRSQRSDSLSTGRILSLRQDGLRYLIYPVLLIVVYTLWASYMAWIDGWRLFATYWPISLTMTLGSFVAGATAEGGAAIAFPVFTKALHINSGDARTFGLMIQAVGMSMAAVMILIQRVKILSRVIFWVTFGGLFGQLVETYWLTIPNPYPKILFTFTATIFGIALFITRWILDWEPRTDLPHWRWNERSLFMLVGLCGGAFAAITGSGIDMLTFIVLTLAFGINEKISTPTTVIIMALNSIVGFGLHGLVLNDIGVAWNYWLVAIPIVIVGAPLGALAATYIHRDQMIIFLLSLIGLELITTLLLVPFNRTSIAITALSVVLCTITFWIMLHYRRQTSLPKDLPPHCDEQTIFPIACDHCHQVQTTDSGDCRWCGTSLAFGHTVPSVM